MKNPEQLPGGASQEDAKNKARSYAREHVVEAEQAFRANDFHKVASILYKEKHRAQFDPALSEALDAQVAEVAETRALALLIKEKDPVRFVEVVHLFGGSMNPDLFPKDLVQTKEILGATKEHFIAWFRQHIHNSEKVVEEIEKFSRFDLLRSVGDIPEIKEIVEEELVKQFENAPAKFFVLRDVFVDRLGIGSKNWYNQMPRVQELAKKPLLSILKTSLNAPQEFSVRLDTYVENGLGSSEDFINLPEVQSAINDRLASERKKGDFAYEKLKKEFVNYGMLKSVS